MWIHNLAALSAIYLDNRVQCTTEEIIMCVDKRLQLLKSQTYRYVNIIMCNAQSTHCVEKYDVSYF